MDEQDNEKSDVSFQVMPRGGAPSYSSEPRFSGAPPAVPPTIPPAGGGQDPLPESVGGGGKMTYFAIAVIVIVILGALAYYFLGTGNIQPSESQGVTTTRLSKPFLTQYFGADVCQDDNKCGDQADPDTDGLTNYKEFIAGTNPTLADSDEDGLADGDEVNIYHTDPMKKFTDSRDIAKQNGYTDGVSIKNGYDPLTPNSKFTESRLAQIKSDTETYGLHEPTKTTLGVAAK